MMRPRHTALAILLFATLASCAGNSTPTGSRSSCNYRPTASGWGDNIDLSQVSMVPRNPYWVKYVPANSPELAISVDNPCAGQPGHVLFAVDRLAAPLPLAVADY
jgi:hypothetical protein